MTDYKYIKWLDDIDKENLNIDGGFCVTSNSYREFIYDNEIDEYIKKMLYGIDKENLINLENISQTIKKKIMESQIPERLIGEIKKAYCEFSRKLDIKNPEVFLSHSGIEKNLSDSSTLEKYGEDLKISGEKSLIDHIKMSWASLWNPKEIYYREKQNMDHFYIPISLVVESILSPKNEILYENLSPSKVLTMGVIASPGVKMGKVRNIKEISQISSVEKGDIIVTAMTSIQMIAAMKIANAVVTDQGGTTSHAAIVCRELQIPCIVSAKDASKILKEGMEITVDGNKGIIYKGYLEI